MKKLAITITGLLFMAGCDQTKKQSANEAIKTEKTVEKVTFESEGLMLTGNLYYPKNYEPEKAYPAVVVSGSWTTVKEQMAGLYA
ncbi:MAG: alpha/beta hydrolase, partial [Ekhidna sp.]|nr:alpha/beta hydrolase [Ekhidna sp.]